MKSLDTTLVAYARAHVIGGHIVSISAEIPQNAALYGGLILRNFALSIYKTYLGKTAGYSEEDKKMDLRTTFSVVAQTLVSGSTLAKAAALRVNLNLDGEPITSRTHTHPSHSETSRSGSLRGFLSC